ncbi:MAG TPA: DUF3237 domain-containing protein [Pseudolabrys sp.]|jgi:hypothetical protein
MSEIKTEFLFTIALTVQGFTVGDTPYGSRRIFRFDSGNFEGPKLKGTVLPGGGGTALTRHDDVLEIEARLTLETNDNEKIYMTWKGLRHGPKDTIDRVNRGEIVDPGTYYFRTTPYFETGSQKYAWLNGICSIATGSREASGRTIQVFQIL